MQERKQEPSFLRSLFFAVFNADAVHKAYALHLFSREFCLGIAAWVISSGVVLLRISSSITLPVWFTVPMTICSIFTGCCWVAFPLLVYLQRKADLLLEHRVVHSNFINTLTGVTLWRRAARGKLTLQFPGALLLDIGFIWLLFPWHIPLSWQTLFHFAFVLNTIFYIAFPLLLFLGKWVQRGIHKELFHRHDRALENRYDVDQVA